MSRKRRKNKKRAQMWQARAHQWFNQAEHEAMRCAMAHWTLGRLLTNSAPLEDDDVRRLELYMAKPTLELRRLMMNVEALAITECIDLLGERAREWRLEQREYMQSVSDLFDSLETLLADLRRRRGNLRERYAEQSHGPEAMGYWADPQMPETPWGWSAAVGEPGDDEPDESESAP